MAAVPTVVGSLPTAELGVTLMHEHLFIINPEVEANYPGEWDEHERTSDAISKLRELEALGVSTLVDMTVLGLGRYIPRIQAVQEHTAINIVVATGIYTYRDLPLYFHFRGPGRMIDGPEVITDLLVRDIRVGIAGTGVRAGMLKCATDVEGVTPDIDRVIRAVAAAHRETGTPITTHTHAATRRGLEQQDILESEGVDLTRVIIGHSGDSSDLDYLRALLDRGSYIGMDRFGLDLFLSSEERIATVVALVKEGWARQLILSTDAPCWSHNWDEDVREQVLPNWRARYLFDGVIPELLRRGVSADDIDIMMTQNPRSVFEATEPY